MEADKRWATGPDCRLGDESGESCFLSTLSRSDGHAGVFWLFQINCQS